MRIFQVLTYRNLIMLLQARDLVLSRTLLRELLAPKATCTHTNSTKQGPVKLGELVLRPCGILKF